MADKPLIDRNEFIVFYNNIGKVSPEIQKSMRKRLNAAGRPIVAQVKQAAMAIPSKVEKGKDQPGDYENLFSLRRSIAQSVKGRFNGTGKGGVYSIRVSTTDFMALSGRSRTIPFYLEGRKKRWRHPVWGDRNVWVDQEARPFLAVTAYKERNVDSIYDAIRASVEDGLTVISDDKIYKTPVS